MLARMSTFTKGHCNVLLPGPAGACCPCTSGRCAFDFAGAGDVESLKCHMCSHRMWDHADSLGADDGAPDPDLERGIGAGIGIGIGDPPPYDEGSRRQQQQQQHQFMTATTMTTTVTPELPTQPAQSHNHYYPREPPVRYDVPPPLATTYSFPARGNNINLPRYNVVRQVPLLGRPPHRTCTANLLIGVILGFVIVATPFIAYRIVTA
ncbi:hypothetical protein DFP73DRAFT_533781 [Morchella snyderi]|nr:hypothetical protein DFP73DRAFT_533781 [Morchella snyderi]